MVVAWLQNVWLSEVLPACRGHDQAGAQKHEHTPPRFEHCAEVATVCDESPTRFVLLTLIGHHYVREVVEWCVLVDGGCLRFQDFPEELLLGRREITVCDVFGGRGSRLVCCYRRYRHPIPGFTGVRSFLGHPHCFDARQEAVIASCVGVRTRRTPASMGAKGVGAF